MSRLGSITRRSFLIGSAAIAGGVLFGTYQYRKPLPNPLQDDPTEQGRGAGITLNPYLKIDSSGVTIITPRAEMGQGVYSLLAMLVAEELDLDWNSIRTTHGPASNSYYNGAIIEGIVPFHQYDHSSTAERMRSFTHVLARFVGVQATGGSSTALDAFEKMRSAGASARISLVAAAAERWQVEASTLQTAAGFVINPVTQARLSYPELAEAAARMPTPSVPPLRAPSTWRYLGQSMPRPDQPSKATGTAQFGIDVRLPELLYATVRMNPYRSGGMKRFDPSTALRARGVQHIFNLGTGFAVVADNTWRAFKAASLVKVDWEAPAQLAQQEQLMAELAAAFQREVDGMPAEQGDVEARFKHAQTVVEAEYQVPYLAHSALEPMNAVAQVRDGEIHIWTGVQIPTQLRDAAATFSGYSKDKVYIHNQFLGGSFGRRLEIDFGMQALRIALQTNGRPVKLTWTREEDIRHDFYRPPALARFKAVMGEQGPLALDVQIASPSLFRSQSKRGGPTIPGPDPMIAEGTAGQPDAIEHLRIRSYAPDLPIPLGSWRSVGASFNGFLHESFMDELAASRQLDPIAMRIPLLKDSVVAQQVVQAVAELAGWGTALPAGRGRGFAYTLSFGAHTAQVVEVTQTPQGIKVDKVYCVMDVGKALDPRNLEAQVQGAIIYGLSAAIMGEITLKDGLVVQSNFHDYPALRFQQSPQIVVKILENNPKLTGAGEPGTPPVFAALANAIFAATGQRIRRLPLNQSISFV